MSARNGPGNGNGRPRQGAPIPNSLHNLDNAKSTRRRTPVWHAHADVRTVIGRAGNPRLVLLVARCPGCHQPHLHLARTPFLATVRKGACGARYMLHALEREAVA